MAGNAADKLLIQLFISEFVTSRNGETLLRITRKVRYFLFYKNLLQCWLFAHSSYNFFLSALKSAESSKRFSRNEKRRKQLLPIFIQRIGLKKTWSDLQSFIQFRKVIRRILIKLLAFVRFHPRIPTEFKFKLFELFNYFTSD